MGYIRVSATVEQTRPREVRTMVGRQEHGRPGISKRWASRSCAAGVSPALTMKAQQVAIVNRQFADVLWPARDLIDVASNRQNRPRRGIEVVGLASTGIPISVRGAAAVSRADRAGARARVLHVRSDPARAAG
jgi:hypothetical protein